MAENGGQSGSDKGGSGADKIKVGEKEYSADDVQNILSQVQTLTQKGESVQGILDAAARYDMEPAEFLEQSMGALSVISNLIKEEVIDEQGNIKAKKEPPKKDDDDAFSRLFGKKDGDDEPPKKTPSKSDEVIAQALSGIKETIGGFGKKLEKLENIQTSMIHDDYRRKIIARHPTLSDKDADRVLNLAMNEGKKDVWGYAEDVEKAKAADVEAIERKYAADHGLDYDKLKEAKAKQKELNEMGDKGGGAPKFEGKKITFNPKSENDLTPLEASQAYLEKNLGGD